ncbi:MAG: hypothetical protein E7773_05055 [Sphingomonas sp.]|uniref:hypothetical protein n=1 Tax=Sphingomonas sp. TaxID=28214 RepID=UPI0012151808|nr:hypothetical protein [Sphingomonas sp.]THD37392.1 MAG: hypothetical protein E7773_05055 [Sphingomonas sp.]
MKGATLRRLRHWHHYIGVFLAPAILFFASSGFLQVVGWQDQRNPPPPAWVSWMAGIHKKQAAPKPRPPAPARPGGASTAKPVDEHHDAEAFVPLKVFALLTALGLFLTTLIGLAVALGTPMMRRTSAVVLTAGVVVPVLLFLL